MNTILQSLCDDEEQKQKVKKCSQKVKKGSQNWYHPLCARRSYEAMGLIKIQIEVREKNF